MFPQSPSWDIEGSATKMRYWSLFMSPYSQNRQSEERKETPRKWLVGAFKILTLVCLEATD